MLSSSYLDAALRSNRAPVQPPCSAPSPLAPAAPVPPSLFDRLADVEVQLILQCLGNSDRIKAARVCHRWLHAARQPLSWMHAAPHWVTEIHADALQRLRASLISHAPAHLRVKQRSANSLSAADVAAGVPRLQGYWSRPLITGRPFDEELLAQPEVQRQVRRLYLDTRFTTSACLQRAAQCMLLHTLHLCAGPDTGSLAALAHCPSLTHLVLSGANMNLHDSGLPHFRHLRYLSLHNAPRWPVGGFQSCFTSPLLADTLEHLALRNHAAMPSVIRSVPAEEEYAHVFRALKRVHTLELLDTKGQDVLLAHVHHAPALTTLRMSADFVDQMQEEMERRKLPTAPVMRTLLAARPQLRSSLLVRGDHSPAWTEPLKSVPRLELVFE